VCALQCLTSSLSSFQRCCTSFFSTQRIALLVAPVCTLLLPPTIFASDCSAAALPILSGNRDVTHACPFLAVPFRDQPLQWETKPPSRGRSRVLCPHLMRLTPQIRRADGRHLYRSNGLYPTCAWNQSQVLLYYCYLPPPPSQPHDLTLSVRSSS
jgi:hypothetical protein